MIKSLMKQDWFHGVVCWIIANYLRLVFVTGRWEMRNTDLLQQYQQRGALVPVMWHNRIAMAALAWNTKQAPLTVLASGHRDGRLVTRTLSHFGVNGISIEPKQTGSAAVRKVVKVLKSGESVVITPDGPRGPRQHLKDGMLTIAKLTKAPILLVSCNISPRKSLKSWDRFILPLPFSRGIIACEEPPVWQQGQDIEEYRQQLEQALTVLTDRMDVELGLDVIPPATDEEIEKALRKQQKGQT